MEGQNVSAACKGCQRCVENEISSQEMSPMKFILELQDNIVAMESKIDSLKCLQKTSMDNSLMVKRKIRSQVNDLVNMLRERENQLCTNVEEIQNYHNHSINEELYKMYDIQAQYRNISVNWMNFKEGANVLNFNEIPCDNDSADELCRKFIIFNGQFDHLREAIKNYGTVKNIDCSSKQYPFHVRNLIIYDENVYGNQVDQSHCGGKSDEQLSLLMNSKLKNAALNMNTTNSEKKSEYSCDSFEILDAENINLNELKEYSFKEEKTEFPEIISCFNLDVSLHSYESDVKTPTVSEWLATSKEIKFSEPSEVKMFEWLTKSNETKKYDASKAIMADWLATSNETKSCETSKKISDETKNGQPSETVMSEWLSVSNKIKNCETSAAFFLPSNNLFEDEKHEPVLKFKKQLEKLINVNDSVNSKLVSGRKHKTGVKNSSMKTEKPPNLKKSKSEEAYVLCNQDTKTWLQKSDSKNSCKSCLLDKSANTLYFQKIDSIQQAFSHYFNNEHYANWLCLNSL